MTEQQMIYMRQIQAFQGEIDALSDKKAEFLSHVPKDQSPDQDMPDQADYRREANRIAGNIGDTLLAMQAVQRLLAELTDVAKPPEIPKLVTVQGYYGLMTLRLTYCGRPCTCDPSVTDEESRLLSDEEVQDWYRRYGWPRSGMMQTADKRGRARGLFRLEVG